MIKKLPKGIRRFIRSEKARIRREFSDSKKREELIKELLQKTIKNKKDDNTGIQQEDKKSGIKKINSSSAAPDSPGGKIS